ncbi:YcnI family protein [Nocardia sp. NPDC052001]|uniref:YcnI family protein n=1 Tax=Nocardia sp. NPDC052001 TaxID=3154853 RepID=UPI003412146A
MRYALTALAVAALSLTAPGVASAHVTVTAPDAAPGGSAVVTVRVPTESATAGTVKVEVTLPVDHPLATVRTQPTPGWQAEAKHATLTTPVDDGHGHKVSDYVSSVVFTAKDGAQIGPGEFGEFKLLIGPLPHVAELAFPAIQTYSDGTTVSWIERSADGTKPDRPAPVLRLTSVNGDGHTHSEAAAPVQNSGVAGWLSGLALILAVAAVGLTLAPRLRRVREE